MHNYTMLSLHFSIIIIIFHLTHSESNAKALRENTLNSSPPALISDRTRSCISNIVTIKQLTGHNTTHKHWKNTFLR